MTLKEKIELRHEKAREETAAKIWELHLKAVAADKEHQENRPERVKEIDAVLDEHLRKLFT